MWPALTSSAPRSWMGAHWRGRASRAGWPLLMPHAGPLTPTGARSDLADYIGREVDKSEYEAWLRKRK